MAPRIITPRRSLVLPRGFRKPAQPVLDPTHPLSKGLAACLLLGDNVKSLTKDITGNGYAGTVNGSLLALSPSHHGGMSDFFTGGNGGNTYVQFPTINPANLFNGSFPWTLSIWVNLATKTNAAAQLQFAIHMRAQWGISVYFDNSGNTFRASWWDGSTDHGATYSNPSINTWYLLTTVWDTNASLLRLYVNGVQAGTVGTGTPEATTDINTLGAQILLPSTVQGLWDGWLEGFRVYNRAISPSEVAQLYAEPYAGIYSAANSNRIGSTSGISGSAAITEADDTSAATGTLKLAANASITEAGDTSSATGTLKLQAAASISEADDTSSASGTLKIVAAAAMTEADDTSTATGALALKASASITEDSDTTSAAAVLPILGTLGGQEDSDTLSATGTGVLTTLGAANITEADDTSNATGTLRIVGAVAIQEAGDTSSGAGILRITATASLLEADDTSSASGVTFLKAQASIQEANDSCSATGFLVITGGLSVTEASDTLAATATFGVAARLTIDSRFAIMARARTTAVLAKPRKTSIISK